MTSKVENIPSAIYGEKVSPAPADEKTVTIGSTRSSFVMLAFGVFMSLALSFTIMTTGNGLKLLTLRWTWRLPGTDLYNSLEDSYKKVDDTYTANILTTKAGLAKVMTDNYNAAGCLASHFDGGIEWGPGSVSPTCHCLRNFHLEYMKAVTPNGRAMTEADMQTPDTKDRVKEMLTLIKAKCFSAIRHTQFEKLDDSAGSNLAVVAACWNAIAMSCVVYMYQSMNNAAKIQSTTKGKAFSALVALAAFLCVVSAFMANGADSTNIGIVECVFTLIYCGVIFTYAMTMPSRLGPWTTYWYACLFFLPFLAQGLNSVMQRRDAWCNHITGVIAASICLVSTAIGFLQADEGGAMHSIKALSSASTGLMVIAAFTFTFPSFPTTPFFNMQFTMLVVAGLLAFPAIYNVIFLHESRSGIKGAAASWWSMHAPSDSFYEVFVVEFLARVIFTFSVMADLWSMQGSDLTAMN